MKNFIRKKIIFIEIVFCFVREQFLDRQGKEFQRLRNKVLNVNNLNPTTNLSSR